MGLIPVLIAGGSGTRLGPLSRDSHPKQFPSLLDDHSLLQARVRRALQIQNAAPPVVMGHEWRRSLILDQLNQIGIEHPTILLEPEGRNTAPAAAAGAHFVAAHFGPDALMFLMAPDQTLTNGADFLASVEMAVKSVDVGRLATFGIKPTAPETGLGYLRKEPVLPGVPVHSKFPDSLKRRSAQAKEYPGGSGHYWNGVLLKAAPITDLLLCPIVYSAAWLLKQVRGLGVHRLTPSRNALLRITLASNRAAVREIRR